MKKEKVRTRMKVGKRESGRKRDREEKERTNGNERVGVKERKPNKMRTKKKECYWDGATDINGEKEEIRVKEWLKEKTRGVDIYADW